GEPRVEGEHLAEQRERAYIETRVRRRAVHEKSGRAHILYQTAADGIRVFVVRVAQVRRRPGFRPARELRVPRLEEGPIQMGEPVHETSIAFEDRLLLGGKGLVRPAEVSRLHADRLRLGLHLDPPVWAHRPS